LRKFDLSLHKSHGLAHFCQTSHPTARVRAMRASRHPKLPIADWFFIALAALAVVALLVSAKAIVTGRTIASMQALLANLPDVAKAAPGQPAILEGKISASVVPLHDEFVAYRRERREQGWRNLDSAKQPLEVETASGTYLIGNDDYDLDRMILRSPDSERGDGPTGYIRGGVRIAGLVANGPVTAFGHLETKAGGRVFHADRAVGLTRSAYAERLKHDHAAEMQLAVTAGAVAVAGFAVCGWQTWRQLRGP
jgi:hypothetical protein